MQTTFGARMNNDIDKDVEENTTGVRGWSFKEFGSFALRSIPVWVPLLSIVTYIVLEYRLEKWKEVRVALETRIGFLESDLDKVKEENAEYRVWLSKSENAIPAIMQRLMALKQSNMELEQSLKANNSSAEPIDTQDKKPSFQTQSFINLARGLVMTDDQTGLEIELIKVFFDDDANKQANILIKFPDENVKRYETVRGGESFIFKSNSMEYELKIGQVYSIADLVEVRVLPQLSK